jgi:hypothetical protein
MRDWGDFRKLFEHPSPAFERLPYAARCMAADIIRRCDRLGRIVPADAVGDTLIEDLVFKVRAHAGEEHFIRECVGVLLADRYLVFENGHLTIRNFVDAQRTASAERMALKRARDAAAAMGDESDAAGPDSSDAPGDVQPRYAGDERDTGDERGVTHVTFSGAGARAGLVSSGLVSGSPEQVGSSKKSGSARVRPAAKAGSEHVPGLIADDWQPSAEQVAALAEKYSVTERRIQAEVREFRWYWREGKGKGKRSTLRGWAQTFANRIELLAKGGGLFVGNHGPAPTESNGDAEARRQRAAEVEARARAARESKRRPDGGEAA